MADVSKVMISVSLLVAFGLIVGVGVLVFSGLNDQFCQQVNTTVINTSNVVYPGGVGASTVAFGAGGGNNNTLYLSIPRNVNITTSSFNITGQNSPQWINYTPFYNYTGHNVGEYSQVVSSDDAPADETYLFYQDATTGTVNISYTTDLDGGAAWTNTSIPNSNTSVGVSADYDDFNNLYWVAWESVGRLYVANGTGTTWDIHLADDSFVGGFGYIGLVAVDDNGHVGASYRDDLNTELKFAEWDTNVWSNETVDATGSNPGGGSSITYDYNANEYHIMYIDTGLDYLKHANGTFGNWSVETIHTDSDYLYTDVEMCSGDIVVTWVNDTDGNVYLTNGTTGSWTDSQISTLGTAEQGTDFTCVGDIAHIFYMQQVGINHTVEYARFNLTSLTVIDTTALKNDGNAVPQDIDSTTNRFNNDLKLSYDMILGFDSAAAFRWINSSYPTDVCLDVDVNGTCDFQQVGQFTTTNNTGNLAAVLNPLVTGCATDPCNITLQVNSTTLGNVLMNVFVTNWSTGGVTGPCDRPAAAASNNFISTLGESTTWVALISAIVILTFVVIYLGKVWIKPGGR